MHSLVGTFIAATALLALPNASSAGDSRVGPRIEHALVSMINDVEVPAQQAGVLVAIDVTEGDQVKTGQLMAQIDDTDPQMQKHAANIRLEAAQTRANDDTPVLYAISARKVAQSRLDASNKSNQEVPGSVPLTEINTLELETERFRLSIEKSRMERKVAQMDAEVHQAEVQIADDSIRRHRIDAPVDGIVVTTFRQNGEWVNPGDPVLRVVRIDRLRVEGFVSARDFDRREIRKRPVKVEIELARGRKVQFLGKVVFVSPVVQAGSKYRVRAEVDNKMENGDWVMGPGMRATMTVHTEAR